MCKCGKTHSADEVFFVSVADYNRHGLLAGPFATHEEAEANVEAVRDIACEMNAKAWFYGFGTSGVYRAHFSEKEWADYLARHPALTSINSRLAEKRGAA